jgi:hypothetical protein
LRTRITTALLIVILSMTTVALGLTFDSGAFGGGQPAGGQSTVASTTTGTPPQLLVRAYSAAQNTPLTSGNAVENLSVLVPIPGLRFTLTATEVALSRLGRPLTYFAFTNSSGEGDISVAAGNYSIQATSSQFNLTRPISFTGNVTTVLTLVVAPVLTNVTSLDVVNRVQSFGLQPGSTIYAQIPGPFNYDRYSLYQIIGSVPTEVSGTVFGNITTIGIVYGRLAVNATVSGYYASAGGTTVVLSPTSSYEQLPVGDIQMLQYVAQSTVSYIGG